MALTICGNVPRRQDATSQEACNVASWCRAALTAFALRLAASLLTLRLAFLGGRRVRRRTDEDRAGPRRNLIRDVRRPPIARRGQTGQRVPRGLAERRFARRRGTGRRTRVLDRVREIGLFGRDQVAKVGLHRGDVRLLLGVRELRNRDRGQNTDDHDHDQQLNQRETLAVHLPPFSRLSCIPRTRPRVTPKQAPCPTLRGSRKRLAVMALRLLGSCPSRRGG